MNNSTRRNLLAKLGLGAAAIAAISVTGISQTAHAEQLAPIDIKRSVTVTAVAEKLQVSVGISPIAKGVVITAKASDAPQIGISNDGKLLNLGVSILGDKVTITGLDSMVNRAAAGRCTITTGDIDLAVKAKAI